MPYIANTAEDQRAMLEAIGIGSLDELFPPIPSELRLKRPLNIPPALTELELTGAHDRTGGKNRSAGRGFVFWAAAATTISFRPWSIRSARAASFIPRTRRISPRPARETCRSSSNIKR